MWQEVTKHQLQSRHILWELAWSNCFNSFRISWWTRQLGWWRGWRWGKLSQHKAFLPPHDLAARHNRAPCLRLCFRGATRVITPATSSADLCGTTKRFKLFPADRTASQYVHQCIATIAWLLLHFKSLVGSMELYDNTPASAACKSQMFPQVLLREESVFMLKQ